MSTRAAAARLGYSWFEPSEQVASVEEAGVWLAHQTDRGRGVILDESRRISTDDGVEEACVQWRRQYLPSEPNGFKRSQ
jgi:hypothetical protein